MLKNVYINNLAGFLPNSPVGNDEMENVLGMVGAKPSRSRRLVLRNNGIKSRYYAIDPATGAYTHNNAQMTAQAVRALLKNGTLQATDIECLCCGTSSPDQLKPAHGSMVQGELGLPPCEVVSTAGVCVAGMTAMKYGYMSVGSGLTKNAVCTGSEFASSFMRSNNFEPEMAAQIENLDNTPALAFEKDFLRWMLSDGAGAALLTPEPNKEGLTLRIDWIESLSYAGEMPVCMYSGAVKRADGGLRGWREVNDPVEAVKGGYFAVKQDARLLDEHIIRISAQNALTTVAKKHSLRPHDVTWFLPHYSSEYFRPKLYSGMKESGFDVPLERWYSNLAAKGNVGSAAIYLIIEEMTASGRLKKGARLLCYIPESARFTICYMLLTVV